MLFKEFANIDAFPICLDTKDVDQIVMIVKAIAPGFGGINLEDISAPRCFEIERLLRECLNIPVFHDDQHGTAVVVLAATINALRVVGKSLTESKVVVLGAGAAGTACAKMLATAGVSNITGCDIHGVIHHERIEPGIEWWKECTNPSNLRGTLNDVIDGADVFLGVSSGGLLTTEMVQRMATNPIVFAWAVPYPRNHA